MSRRQHSIAYITVNGVGLLASMPGAKLVLGGVKKTPFMSGTTLVGFSEEVLPARLELELSMDGRLSLAALQRLVDETVTYEADTGQTYVIRSASTANVIEIDKGLVRLELFGNPAVEMDPPPLGASGA